jgi:hypothetical protein
VAASVWQRRSVAVCGSALASGSVASGEFPATVRRRPLVGKSGDAVVAALEGCGSVGQKPLGFVGREAQRCWVNNLE